jgi:hypothetical protein
MIVLVLNILILNFFIIYSILLFASYFHWIRLFLTFLRHYFKTCVNFEKVLILKVFFILFIRIEIYVFFKFSNIFMWFWFWKLWFLSLFVLFFIQSEFKFIYFLWILWTFLMAWTLMTVFFLRFIIIIFIRYIFYAFDQNWRSICLFFEVNIQTTVLILRMPIKC